jgi:hypothetical protein
LCFALIATRKSTPPGESPGHPDNATPGPRFSGGRSAAPLRQPSPKIQPVKKVYTWAASNRHFHVALSEQQPKSHMECPAPDKLYSIWFLSGFYVDTHSHIETTWQCMNHREGSSNQGKPAHIKGRSALTPAWPTCSRTAARYSLLPNLAPDLPRTGFRNCAWVGSAEKTRSQQEDRGRK